MIVPYACTNPDCDAVTFVREWPATRLDPPDSTWGDGCSTCGAELQEEPEEFDEMEPEEEPKDQLKRERDLEYIADMEGDPEWD